MERLGPEDAAALDLDPDRVTYTPLGDLGTATEKARGRTGDCGLRDLRQAITQPAPLPSRQASVGRHLTRLGLRSGMHQS